MIADPRAVYTELGTAVLIMLVASGAWRLATHAFEFALHLTLALGLARPTALASLALIVVAQLGACVVLMAAPLYNRIGSVAPSALLTATLWFEALVFGDTSDAATQAKCICLTATAFLLAIFRYDRQARNARDQIPSSGVLLSIEAAIKATCTRLMAGFLLPPTAVALMVWTLGWNAFWRESGVMREYRAGWCRAGLSAIALCLILSGQDAKAHVVLGEQAERAFDLWAKRRERLLGEGPRRDAKKAL